MKYQILLLTLLVGVALAFPVPDEEVSPGSAAAAHIGEIKSESTVDKQALKTIINEETKTKEQPIVQEKQQESKKIFEDAKPKVETIKKEEKQPLFALSAPDSELPQNLPEQQKPLTEIKEKEKNIRSENLATEDLKKSQPSGVFETPVVAPAAIETQRQLVEEEKPVIQVILPEGKISAATSAAAAIATEEKQLLEEKTLTTDSDLPLSATADAVPATTYDIVATPAVDESKKVDLTGRQERGGNEAKKEVEEIKSEVPVFAPTEAPKLLENEKHLNSGEQSLLSTLETEFKPKIENTVEELKSSPVGDIEKQAAQPLDENEKKIQEITEKKDSSSNILPEGKEIETDVAKEDSVIKPDATDIKEAAKPLTTSDSKDSSEEKKDSLESKESAESGESKAKSEENMSN